jgi:hypothetical protein
MPTSYTSVLRIAKPATGELSGTWGDVVNDNITTMLEQAITGVATVAMADANQTLTTANGTTDQARCMMVECTGALTGNKNVVCPTATKLYLVNNKTTGGFSIVFKTTAGSGITVAPSTSQLVYCDGTNVVSALYATTAGAAASATTATTATNVAVGGITGLGTNVATALAVNVGAAGAVVVRDGVLGTPSSGTLTSCTGLPAAGVTGTAATLNGAQTFITAAKTFTNSLLKLLGSSTGATTFTSANAGASDYTLTIPAATMTMAGIDKVQAFTKGQSGTPVALSVSANAVAVDLSLGNNFTLTLQATTAQTLSNPTNVVAGQKGAIYITQNGTPSTLAVASNWIEASTGTNPGVSTTASAQNILTYDVFDSTHIYYTIMKHGVA